jgi:23S rRNA pseudouridine1911/1915/1917 synthase
MNKTMKFSVDKRDAGTRIDIYLTKKISKFTRSFLKKIILTKNLKINNTVVSSPSTKIKTKDIIFINILSRNENRLIPKKIKIDIVYEDNDILIINKPKGMVVHPGAGNVENTLANALAYKYKKNLSNLNGELRPGIVHRIDKETSGLLVVAKNNLAHSNLGKQFSHHTIKRKYLCLAWGVIRPLSGRIKTLISRDNKNRQLMTVSETRGKIAITNYKTLRVYNIKNIPKISFLECELETGRTHQIRVHLKSKGISLIGDNQYGKKNIKFKRIDKIFLEKLNNIKGQALHAQTLEFEHPTKRKWVSFKTNVPDDFKKMLDLLNKLHS